MTNLWVARIDVHDEGTFSYIYYAPHSEAAQVIARTLIAQSKGDTAELIEVLPAAEYVGGEILELCAF